LSRRFFQRRDSAPWRFQAWFYRLPVPELQLYRVVESHGPVTRVAKETGSGQLASIA
jgi:hypothetical protein